MPVCGWRGYFLPLGALPGVGALRGGVMGREFPPPYE